METCPSILSTPLPPFLSHPHFPPIRVILALLAPQEGLVTQAAKVHLEPRSEYCTDHTSAFFTPYVLPSPLTFSPHLLPSPSPLTFSPHLLPSPSPLTFSPHLLPSPSPPTPPLPHLPTSSLPPSLSLFSLPPFSLHPSPSSLLRVKKVVKGTEA